MFETLNIDISIDKMNEFVQKVAELKDDAYIYFEKEMKDLFPNLSEGEIYIIFNGDTHLRIEDKVVAHPLLHHIFKK